MTPYANHPEPSGSRDLVKAKFAVSGSEYDATRFAIHADTVEKQLTKLKFRFTALPKAETG